MATTSEIVNLFFESINSGDFTQAETYLSDSFKVDLPIPLPIVIGKYQISLLLNLVKDSIAEFKMNFKESTSNDTQVEGSVKFSGIHKVDFSIPGFPSIKASNKEINLPETNVILGIENEKIKRFALNIPNIHELIGKLMNTEIPNVGTVSDLAKNAGINIPGM